MRKRHVWNRPSGCILSVKVKSGVRIGSSTNSSKWPFKVPGNPVPLQTLCSVSKLATLPSSTHSHPWLRLLAERDEYLDHSIFVFGQAVYDHNFSQGLTLQHTYGGGIGWTVIQDPNQTLDLKGSVVYIRQQFEEPPDQDLIGSIFAEHYRRKFKRGLVADQQLFIQRAWNGTRAYSASFNTLLTLPVYKRLVASTGVIDTFLNDPPAGFKKNSFQFTLGLTYTLP